MKSEFMKMPIEELAEGRIVNVSSMISDYGVTEEDVAHIKETSFLYQKMLPRGHMIAIVGVPGSGKTTVMEYVMGQIVKVHGMVGLYITADIGAGDVPEARRRAVAGGYSLLCPDIKTGKSMDDIIADLITLSKSDEDLANVIITIDTLKKITEVISKGASASIYKLLRSLTGQGATIVCLGHCNKYYDADGWPVYEGTGDLRSDFDELALLHPLKGDYESIVTSIYWSDQGCPWAKARALVGPMSWEIDINNNRTVSELDSWVDTLEEGKEKREAKQTADVIRMIYTSLKEVGPMSQKEITERLQAFHSKRVTHKVLKQQAGKMWGITRGEHNASIHTAIPGVTLPNPVK